MPKRTHLPTEAAEAAEAEAEEAKKQGSVSLTENRLGRPLRAALFNVIRQSEVGLIIFYLLTIRRIFKRQSCTEDSVLVVICKLYGWSTGYHYYFT